MTTALDLGIIEPPLLFFGGPYGNLQATRALRDEAERRGFTPDRVICTGDVVAYCGAPAETVAFVRDWGIPVVLGNVEEQIGANAADCACGYEEGSACEVLSRDWYARCVAALDPDAAAWMATRPPALRFAVGGTRFAVIHGGAERNNQLVFSSTPKEEKARQRDLLDADVVIAGHSSIPFTETVGRGIWHNAGVIGMPANDGTPDVWYSTLERRSDGALFLTHHRLAYDHESATADMHRRGFPEDYAETLATGLWPSLDILPERERAETGKRLAPEGVEITLGLEAVAR
jgi:predicted phosphodiesterase